MAKKLDSIKIGGIRYSVAYMVDLRDEKDNQKLDGRLQHALTKISIDASLNHQATVQTLLHEVVHAVAAQIGKARLDENVVDALAYSVYQVMRDNPKLVRMITTTSQ